MRKSYTYQLGLGGDTGLSPGARVGNTIGLGGGGDGLDGSLDGPGSVHSFIANIYMQII